MRVAAVDCGTNSIRLLVADRAGATLTDVVRRMEVVRLGYRVDTTGQIAPESMNRALAMAREYAAVCDELDVEAVRFVTTSAARDARNADEFIAGVRDAFGPREVSPEVLSGAEEARLSFLGAAGDVVASGAPAPYLVIDLGGGSTEFVRGRLDRESGPVIEGAISSDMGCVRMTERHLRGDPPAAAGLEAARADIETRLDRVEEKVGLAGIGTLVGLAGTVTTVTAHALRLDEYDSGRIHRSVLSVADTLAACRDMQRFSRSTRAALPYMHPGRVDVIAAGALIWQCIVERVARRSGVRQVLTSERDILDGIALGLTR